MNLSKDQLRRVLTPLVIFFGDSVGVEDEITLFVMVGRPLEKYNQLTFIATWDPRHKIPFLDDQD